MLSFFQLVANLWSQLIAMFDARPIAIGVYRVSFFSLLFAFFAISFVISVFWKGAKA